MSATPSAAAPAAAGRGELLSLEEMSERLERALATSAADETELVWLETRRGEAAARGQRIHARSLPERTILVRVLDRGRVGSFRTCGGEPGELESAVRMAVAQSRLREPLAGLPHLPADETPLAAPAPLADPELAALEPAGARDLVTELRERRETIDLVWTEARVAVFSSRKVRRSATVTAVELAVRRGRRPGGGRAATAARSLAGLAGRETAERARARHGTGAAEEPPATPVPVVLAPEAAIRLVELLNGVSFSAMAYYDGTSFLREHLGVQVFDRAINLRDDGTDPAGLPFPFDLEGTAKRRVDLILKGAPRTPTLDQRQAAVLGLPPTAHAIGGNNARAEHLFLEAGELGSEELLAAADGGLWIGDLEPLEPIEPRRVTFRARAVGVRRIEGGRLAAPVVDLAWEDSLLRALASVAGMGRETTRRLGPDRFTGGISAPAIALAEVPALSPWPRG